MGVFKRYNALEALYDYFLLQTSDDRTVRPYKNISGTEYTYIYGKIKSSTYITDAVGYYNPISSMTPYAVADILDNYNKNDYQVNEVGTVTKTTATNGSANGTTKVYTLVVENNTEQDISVGAIKFTKQIPQGSGTWGSLTECLCYAYFLDSAVIIAPNEQKTFTVTFKV